MSLSLPTIILFTITGVTTINDTIFPDWMQYGAFGLCCILVLYLIYQIQDMGKIIRSKDKQYIDLLREDIQSRNNLTNALRDRPCLGHDERTNQNGSH